MQDNKICNFLKEQWFDKVKHNTPITEIQVSQSVWQRMCGEPMSINIINIKKFSTYFVTIELTVIDEPGDIIKIKTGKQWFDFVINEHDKILNSGETIKCDSDSHWINNMVSLAKEAGVKGLDLGKMEELDKELNIEYGGDDGFLNAQLISCSIAGGLVHGHYTQVKAVQKMIIENENLRKTILKMREVLDASHN